MKIPTVIRPSTSAPSGAHSYTEGDSRNGLSMVGQGLSKLGGTLGQVSEIFEQRNSQLDRFNTLKGFSEFETQASQSLTDLKRGYSADGKGFTKAASELYDKQADQFAAQVPPELQGEFRARVAQHKQGVMGEALTFQYAAGDAWFKQGVDDEVSKSQGVVDQTPSALAQEQKRIADFINATDLPEAVKLDYARNANIKLESATYKAEVRSNAGDRYSMGVGQITDFTAGARAVIKKEEGYVDTAMWDKNHARVGYSSDTITNPDGSFRMVRDGDVTTRADADRDLDRRIADADRAGRGAVGADRWNGLGANVKAGLASVYYHYGKYPQSVIRAVETGSSVEIASAVRDLDSNKPRREREAKIIEGSEGISADPRFDNIPYETKMALRDDADREAAQAANAKAAAEKDALNQQQERLYTGLYDGVMGAADIQAARDNGTLNSYETIKKANDILAKVNETTNLQGNALTKLQTSGAVWDPSNEDDKKMLNALVGKGGIERLSSGDQDYVKQGIIPLVSQTGDIPTDVAGTLTGMFRGNSGPQAMFALDTLAQLRDTNPLAFNQRVGNDVAQAVELWDMRKDIAPDKGTLLDDVRGGTTAQERNNRNELRRDAQAILSKTEGGVPNLQTLAQRAMGEFGGSFLGIRTWSPTGYVNPQAQQSFNKEFSTLFVDKYSVTGNVDSAVDLATKELQRNWGVTAVGDQSLLMKYPPEKVGYRAIGGSYDWINEQARKELSEPQFLKPSGLTPQEEGLLNYSRDNMRSGKVLEEGGDITSVYITGVTGPDGRIYNVPGYADGKKLTDEEASDRAAQIGWDQFPAYGNGKEADAAAEKVHQYIDRDTEEFVQNRGNSAERFQLFSDEQTKQEWDKFKSDPAGRPPSYLAFVIDQNGVAKLKTGADGKPTRIWFQAPQEKILEEQESFDRKAETYNVEEIIANYPRLQAGALASGTQVPKEDTDAYNRAIERRNQLQEMEKARARAKPPAGAPKPNEPNIGFTPWGAF